MAGKRKRKGVGTSFCASVAMEKLHTGIAAVPAYQSGLAKLLRSIQEGLRTAPAHTGALVAEDLLHLGLLEALLFLLNSHCEDVLVESLEVIGALAFTSYQVNCKVVLNKDILKLLVGKMVAKHAEVNIAACNTALELAITEDGKTNLQESGVMEPLIAGVMNMRVGYVDKDGLFDSAIDDHSSLISSKDSDTGVCSSEHDDNYSSSDAESHDSEAVEELFLVTLDTVNMLNSSKAECLFEGVSEATLKATLLSLKRIWQNFKLDQYNFKIDISARCGVLAKLIVQLSSEGKIHISNKSYGDAIKKTLFKGMDREAELFFQEYWEHFPLLITRDEHTNEGDIFSLLQNHYCKASASDLLEDLLAQNVTCPAISADELNLSSILKEVEDQLGKPMVYDQDIRLVKSVPSTAFDCSTVAINSSDHGLRELHYFERSSSGTSYSEDHVYAKDCLMAFDAGYSVALRGMQFRSPVIAAIADALALTFGQASVGVNLYLTPCNSQGFALHYDDHCVLALQLSGLKKWKVYASHHKLPQLYCNRGTLDKDFVEGKIPMEFVLEMGDVLYIPRGFPHEAQALNSCQTDNKECSLQLRGNQCLLGGCAQARLPLKTSNVQSKGCILEGLKVSKCADGKNTGCTNTYSLHLTFAVEVELPFTWEGLVHIALHDWRHGDWEHCSNVLSQSTLPDLVEKVCTLLLHIAIRLIGCKHEAFRKACLVAAKPFDCNNYMAALPYHDIFTGREIQEGCQIISSVDSQSCLTPEVFFSSLIELVKKNAQFDDAYKSLQEEIRDHGEHFLGWMGWLRHLPGGMSSYKSTELLFVCTHVLQLGSQQEAILKLKQGFENLKRGFVQGAVFGSASRLFLNLLWQYQTLRQRFVNGMLALHLSS
ncbi:hypothetical protein O6H91_07G116500 [Diphasiastrum complanatum]|uniref:Uncharacterized protein n=1 Tax=Diphasiastrum complanatum TaxID=34168 RepID=A0ACC2D910_DIPCM|nr:hypothetical protein O6H91_07G116500 [Diphasiastrum complanatum]